MSIKIAAIVNFCTNDYRFFDFCIKQIKKFTNQIYISVCDHFFNGEPENYRLLEQIYLQYNRCRFIEYEFNNNDFYGPLAFSHMTDRERAHYWHNVGRLCPFYFINKEIDWLFFFDIDEVPDGDKIKDWFDFEIFDNYSALRFASYLYFREAKYRATRWQCAPLLVKKNSLYPEQLLHVNERKGILENIEGETRTEILSREGLPMIHHYNWVRSKEEIYKKVETWAHKVDVSNWKEIIEKAYDSPFQGTDFFGEDRYEMVLPYFDPLAVKIPNVEGGNLQTHLEKIASLSHVTRVTPKDIFHRDLSWRLETEPKLHLL